jgi:beta-glucanase (GH16 family)
MTAMTGMWPAFWMLGAKGDWPSCGEIDIMEAKGREPAVIYGTTHWGPLVGGNHPNYGKTFQFPSGQDITGWHEYTFEWNQRLMTFWVDDFPIYLTMNTIDPFNQDFYLILNLAVGGMFDNYLEPPQTFIAQRMLVDYVRVYQPAPDPQSN